MEVEVGSLFHLEALDKTRWRTSQLSQSLGWTADLKMDAEVPSRGLLCCMNKNYQAEQDNKNPQFLDPDQQSMDSGYILTWAGFP